jgi:phytoene dehydrogenase-like protein
MLWMSVMTVQPPDRPGTGLLAYSLAYGRQQHSWTIPRGGSAALPIALARVIEDHGGTVVAGRRVTGLVVEGGRCVGVETAEGETYRARRAVVSTIHVKHLVEMAPRALWGEEFLYGVEAWRPGLALFPTHLATTEAPAYPLDGGEIVPVASGTAPSVERLLRMGNDAERGVVADEDPVLLVVCATVADPSRAPEGQHVLKVIGFQPYELADGGPERWDEIKDDVARANLDQLRRYAPNLSEAAILAQTVKSPLDLERMNAHNWHGTCHGGDMSPSQAGALRFAPRTPIPGLYQTGATTHPGGSVSAAPGRNTALVLLEELGSSVEDAVAAVARA